MRSGIFAAILILSLLACVPGFAAERAAPKPGEKIEGFTVTELGRIESLDADTVTLRHDRSGATAVFVLNDDVNRGFSICFHTEPDDDSGMLHILEHAVCAASRKYPGRDVFFDAIAQAYITDINAWTSLSSTNYYVTSMSEDQLEVLADFYLDCAFDSAILSQPNYFYREGWRYEMADADAELGINGIVYNEMLGVNGSIYNVAYDNLQKALFPDSYQSRISGGDPRVIPTLSYEKLIDFYKSCYNPGNSVSMFYGDLDMARFLRLLNEGYFSKAQLVEQAPIGAGQKPFAEPVHEKFAFPVGADAEQEGSMIYLGFALSGGDTANATEYALWDAATGCLSDESTPLMKALNASGIGSSYGVYVSRAGTQDTLLFYATDADGARDLEFKQIVLDKIEEMAEAGLSDELLRALFSQKIIAQRLARNSDGVAKGLFENLTWISETGDYSCIDQAAAVRAADALCRDGYLEKQLMERIVSNPHCALCTTTPEKGLLEKKQQALADELAEKKAAMSAEEKQKIVEDTERFGKWLEETTPQETLDKINVVNAATVPAEWADRRLTDEQIGSVRVLTAQAAMDMTAVEMQLDLSHLTVSEMRKLKMYTLLIGLSTERYEQDQLSALKARLLSNLSVTVNAAGEKDEARPVLQLFFFAPGESLEEAVDLAFEMLSHTKIRENADLLLRNIAAGQVDYSAAEWVWNNLLPADAQAPFSAQKELDVRLSGLDYLVALKEAESAYGAEPEAFLTELASIRDRALTKSGARILLAGDGDGAARAALLKRIEELPEAEAAAYSPETAKARSLAYAGSTQADYLRIGGSLNAIGEKLTGDKLLLCKILSSEYLTPELRLKGGAYGAGMNLNYRGDWSLNYFRGDDFVSALAAIDAMPAYLQNLSLTQEQLDAYKLPIISDYLTSAGELNDGLSDLVTGLDGFTREDRLRLIDEVRAVTVEDVKALAPVLGRMLETGARAVITDAAKANKSADLFDEIRKLP